MKRFILLVPLLLAGCDDRPEEQRIQEMNSRLPRGCKFLDLGRYNGDRIYAVRCDGSVTTTNWSWRAGKNSTYYAASIVDAR